MPTRPRTRQISREGHDKDTRAGKFESNELFKNLKVRTIDVKDVDK